MSAINTIELKSPAKSIITSLCKTVWIEHEMVNLSINPSKHNSISITPTHTSNSDSFEFIQCMDIRDTEEVESILDKWETRAAAIIAACREAKNLLIGEKTENFEF